MAGMVGCHTNTLVIDVTDRAFPNWVMDALHHGTFMPAFRLVMQTVN